MTPIGRRCGEVSHSGVDLLRDQRPPAPAAAVSDLAARPLSRARRPSDTTALGSPLPVCESPTGRRGSRGRGASEPEPSSPGLMSPAHVTETCKVRCRFHGSASRRPGRAAMGTERAERPGLQYRIRSAPGPATGATAAHRGQDRAAAVAYLSCGAQKCKTDLASGERSWNLLARLQLSRVDGVRDHCREPPIALCTNSDRPKRRSFRAERGEVEESLLSSGQSEMPRQARHDGPCHSLCRRP